MKSLGWRSFLSWLVGGREDLSERCTVSPRLSIGYFGSDYLRSSKSWSWFMGLWRTLLYCRMSVFGPRDRKLIEPPRPKISAIFPGCPPKSVGPTVN